MDRSPDLEVTTVLRWVVVCQEVRQRERRFGDEEGAEPRGAATATGSAAATGGGQGVIRVSESGIPGDEDTPPTPTVEELLKATEDGATLGDSEVAMESETATVGRFTVTPVLRSSVVEPRSGDGRIGASEPVPFVGGDFLESADPPDILDALGVDPRVADVLREVESPDVRTAATLLGVILNRGDNERIRMAEEGPESEGVVEGRVTVVVEARAYVGETRSTFLPETYSLRLHCFEPVGITNYAPVNADYSGDMLLRDRDRHISSSRTTRTTDVYGHGGSAKSLAHFRALPQRVQELVEAAGFGPFIQLQMMVRVDHAVLTVLTKRWWDTTNTFHFQFGEMTVTPLDFTAITGLRVGGEPIPYDTGLVNDNAALIWFLGRVPLHSGGLAAYGQFTTYWDHEPKNDEEAAQMARGYLLYLFGASLFPNRRTHVHLGYLAALVDLRATGRFDWGGAALCTLYCFLGAATRRVGNTVRGYWRVVELWAYEVLGMFPPENTCKDPNLFPRGLVWNKEYRKTKERRGEAMTFRRWLDNLTGVLVHWKCWDKLEAECLVRSRKVTRSRVLLESPLGWQWYLGDRVTRQSLGLLAFAVPGPLPPRVQRTDTYTHAELEQFTMPNTNLEGFFRRTMDYNAYKERYLAMSLGVEQELQRRVAETEARRTASETRAETGGEGGRGGHSQRARGRGRGTSFRGRGRGSVEATARSEDVSEAPGMPKLKWEISVRDHTGARAIVDIPRLPRPAMNILDPFSREWAESAIMRMLGMRKLLRDCARGKTLQTCPVAEPAATPAAESPQVQTQTRRKTRAQSQATTVPPMPRVTQAKDRQFELRARPEVQRQLEPEESEESNETERSEESLGASDSDSDSSLPDPSDSDSGNDDDDSSEEGDPPQKKSRHV